MVRGADDAEFGSTSAVPKHPGGVRSVRSSPSGAGPEVYEEFLINALALRVPAWAFLEGPRSATS